MLKYVVCNHHKKEKWGREGEVFKIISKHLPRSYISHAQTYVMLYDAANVYTNILLLYISSLLYLYYKV